MDYKMIVKSPEKREAILNFLNWIPDSIMIRIQYWVKTNRKLNLKNPKRFTEKLQWYKIYYKNSDMVRCVDKYDVRQYVRERGLEEILNPIYGVYEDSSQIIINALPSKFVAKDTLGGGGRSIIICGDKNKFDFKKFFLQVNKWTVEKKRGGGREWPYYSGRKGRILIEKFIEKESDEISLLDYKFFCFNGKAKYLYVITDREIGESAALGIFDINFNQLNVMRADEKALIREIKKPMNYKKMIEIVEKLAQGFPHVRVDLYNVNGKIIFGELTFFDGSGYMKFVPDEFDFELGQEFQIPIE